MFLAVYMPYTTLYNHSRSFLCLVLCDPQSQSFSSEFVLCVHLRGGPPERSLFTALSRLVVLKAPTVLVNLLSWLKLFNTWCPWVPPTRVQLSQDSKNGEISGFIFSCLSKILSSVAQCPVSWKWFFHVFVFLCCCLWY